MLHHHLSAFVLSLMQSAAPSDLFADLPTYPEALESREERLERYLAIADDIAAVALEKSTSPRARARTAAYLAAVAWKESGFFLDVDVGPCAPAKVAKGWCDSGRAKTLWQLQGLTHWPTRREAARIAVDRMRQSFRACRLLPPPDQLAAFAAGNCGSVMGRVRSRERTSLAERWAGMWTPER